MGEEVEEGKGIGEDGGWGESTDPCINSRVKSRGEGRL